MRKGNLIARDYAGNKVDSYIYAVEKSLDSYKFNLLQNKQLFITQLKQNRLGSRTIDEGAMDESGGMNYAEYIAVLSGNTDLLERAKLEKKIATLESEKQAFNRSKGTTSIELGSLQRDLDFNQSIIERMRKDYAYLEKVAPKNDEGVRSNPLQIDGATNSSTDALAARLKEIDEKVKTGEDHQKIGSLYDFRVLVKTENSNKFGELFIQNRFSVEGLDGIKYTYNNGMIAQDPKLAVSNFINALEKIPELIANHHKKVTEIERELPVLKEVVNAKFSKDVELQNLKNDLSSLDRHIQLTLNKPKDEEAVSQPIEPQKNEVSIKKSSFKI